LLALAQSSPSWQLWTLSAFSQALGNNFVKSITGHTCFRTGARHLLARIPPGGTLQWHNIKRGKDLARRFVGMLDVDRGINSISSFRRYSSGFIRQLKETGQSITPAINGKSEPAGRHSTSLQKPSEFGEQAD